MMTRWALSQDGVVRHGGLDLVVPVCRGNAQYVLKFTPDFLDAAQAALALGVWAGRGAVLLEDADPERGVLLLERLDDQRTTATLATDAAFDIAAGLLRQLGVLAPPGIPTQQAFAETFIATAYQRWEDAGAPFSPALIDEAQALARSLGPSAGDLLVHWDLHDANILAGVRTPWLAIDPKAIAGDLEFGIAQLLWRRLDHIPSREALHAHIRRFCDSARLDSERAIAWSRLRCIDYWLWGISVGLTEDPKRCRSLLALLR
jgi:streptomycin 6-kinase